MEKPREGTYAQLAQCKNPEQIMESYFRGLVARNSAKYSSYVFGMKWILPTVMGLPGTVRNAHKILTLTYAACRIVDDYVDGDFPDVKSSDIVAYTQERIAFLNAHISGVKQRAYTPEDKLFEYMFSLMPNQNEAERIQTSTKMIVESMLFDAIRIQKYRHSGQLEFPREDDLHAHFVLMDVRGTGGALSTLIQLGEHVSESVESVGLACRIEYTLNDLPEDIGAGIVNISQEDTIKYGITTRDLETIKALPSVSLVNPKAPSRILYQDADAYPESVRKWIRSEIAKYEKLMERVDPDEINKLSFHAKFFYRFAYKRPSDRVIAQLKTKFHA